MKPLKNYGILKNKIIKPFIIGALIATTASFYGCSESSPAPTNNQGSSQSPVETLSGPVNVGPTGASDPITNDDINTTDEVIFYNGFVDPDVSQQLPGTPYESCGTVYRQFNNPEIFFRSENNQLYTLKEFSYDSVTFLRNIRFKMDSYSVCLEGYRDGSNVYLNTTSQQQAITHPLKSLNGQYSYELCGHLAYTTNFNGVTSLNLKIDQYYYNIEQANMNVAIPQGIPNLSTSITEQNSIEACLYSNQAAYRDTSRSFRPFFNVEAFDLGALNQ